MLSKILVRIQIDFFKIPRFTCTFLVTLMAKLCILSAVHMCAKLIYKQLQSITSLMFTHQFA